MRWRQTRRPKELNTKGVVTDMTPNDLITSGWSSQNISSYEGLWIDPRTGRTYTITEAAAIRLDRLTPRYQFHNRGVSR